MGAERQQSLSDTMLPVTPGRPFWLARAVACELDTRMTG